MSEETVSRTTAYVLVFTSLIILAGVQIALALLWGFTWGAVVGLAAIACNLPVIVSWLSEEALNLSVPDTDQRFPVRVAFLSVGAWLNLCSLGLLVIHLAAPDPEYTAMVQCPPSAAHCATMVYRSSLPCDDLEHSVVDWGHDFGPSAAVRKTAHFIHFRILSPWLGLPDDVLVRLTPVRPHSGKPPPHDTKRCVVVALSQSRLGSTDFSQNQARLLQLRSALDQAGTP
eukprot:RCo038929